MHVNDVVAWLHSGDARLLMYNLHCDLLMSFQTRVLDTSDWTQMIASVST